MFQRFDILKVNLPKKVRGITAKFNVIICLVLLPSLPLLLPQRNSHCYSFSSFYTLQDIPYHFLCLFNSFNLCSAFTSSLLSMEKWNL